MICYITITIVISMLYLNCVINYVYIYISLCGYYTYSCNTITIGVPSKLESHRYSISIREAQALELNCKAGFKEVLKARFSYHATSSSTRNPQVARRVGWGCLILLIQPSIAYVWVLVCRLEYMHLVPMPCKTPHGFRSLLI